MFLHIFACQAEPFFPIFRRVVLKRKTPAVPVLRSLDFMSDPLSLGTACSGGRAAMVSWRDLFAPLRDLS